MFFAFTGALQTFSLHEHRPGDTYQPPEWIRVLAQVHKKQTSMLPPARPETNRNGAPRRAPSISPQVTRLDLVAQLAFKWFVLAMSLGLMATTGLGIYMAFKFNPGRRLMWILLALGTVLPVGIVFL